MIKKLTVFSIAICFLAACNSEKGKDKAENQSIKGDTLTYTYDSVKVISKTIVNTVVKNADTTKAVIKYPVFKNQPLNTYIERQVFDYISKEEPVTSYEDIANSFIKGYDSFQAENKDRPQSWYLWIDIKVLRQNADYIALKHIHSDYAGGAHGITNISFINYNPKTNKPIVLDSLIQTSEKSKLVSIAEMIFRKNEKISATQSLADQYFFDKGIFSLPSNFYVSDSGLVFLYNPYEIKPYAAGITELVIPFAALKNIAKPNSILTVKN
jgi:hypothetical protein